MSENKTDQNQLNSNNPDPNYWRSFQELYNQSEVIENRFNEFGDSVKDDFSPNQLSGLSRRKFLALLGASAALAGTACTDYRDKGEIIPYNVKPEEITVGKPNYYASTCTACNLNCGILIKTREGRPIKVDGNPDHPVNKGKICAKGQANILNLYDPERIKSPLKKSSTGFDEIDWTGADQAIVTALKNSGDKEIAVLSHTITSPTTLKVLNDFKKQYPSLKHYSYELFSDSTRNAAWKKCYNNGNFPLIAWNKANVILALESDFLGSDGEKVETIRMFSEAKDVDAKKFNRLYSVEGNMTLTGINADYRLRLKPELQFSFVMSLMNELTKKGIINSSVDVAGYDLLEFINKNKLDKARIIYLVNDLAANKGKSIVYAGDSLPENVHIAVNLLNQALGNSVLYRNDQSKVKLIDLTASDEIKELVDKINSGNVSTVIHFNCNPVYHFPLELKYKTALSKVKNVISLSERLNETTQVSTHVLPINHNFESWGDSKTRTGFFSLQQPVISPIHKTRQGEAILLNWISENPDNYSDNIYHEYLKKNWETSIYPTVNSRLDFKRFWFGALHDGIVLNNERAEAIGTLNTGITLEDNNLSSGGFNLIVKESSSLADGRFSHNGWLQELPHPVSKINWDNYAAISHASAKELGVKNYDLVDLEIGNRKLTIPVFVQAGVADNVVAIESGYGREFSGTVSSGVGFNVNQLLTLGSDMSPWIFNNVKISKNGASYTLASTEEHHAFDDTLTKDLHKKRHIIQEGTVALYLKNPKFIQDERHGELESVYSPHPYDGVKWGMAIDLNKCIGCGDCVVACNVENNVPVVGKDQVLKSREMQWLRIDRYYSGTPEDPSVSVQPMLCQHCDQAPCENVCPVVATTHSPDGLNQMVYNRCVGTRYCSNNCPYKVRRFNFFNYRDHFRDGYQENPVLALLHNPEVTVRSRGVMEKCTFCVQRISEARAIAAHEKRDLKGSDVTTACQDACGTNAIHFGDINNKESEFYKYRNHELGYYVLEELNVKPNVTYMAKLRNTHTEDI